MKPPQWWAGVLICAVCDKQHAAVCELPDGRDEPDTGQECPHCGAMSCVISGEMPEDYKRGF